MWRNRLGFPLRALGPLGAALLSAACHHGPAPASSPTSRDSVEVGYGAQERRDVTGAISSVSGEEARRSSPTSIAQMLQGRFPGVEVEELPGEGITVRIRGQRSINGNNEPLYVIDGVPVHTAASGALVGLDPRAIKRIEVLKDAGSTAAYGSRGANGVILITTNRSH